MDWEHQNFSLSSCIFAENSPQSLVAIASSTSSSSSSGSSKVGIAVGVTVGVVVLIAAAIAAFFVIRRRKRRQAVAAGKNYEDPSEKIRQGFAKGELGAGHDNQRYEMAGSDPHQTKKTDDNDIPGWVNEKANYPGDRAGMVEADGGDGSARAELGGPVVAHAHGNNGSTVRPLHEMHDPHSQPTFELPADTPGELQGSTPGSSVPASPVSSTRPRPAGSSRHSRAGGSLGGFRSPFSSSKPTSPLSGAAQSSASASSGSPYPSTLDRRLDLSSNTSAGNPASSRPSRSSFLGGLARLGGGNRSSAARSSEYSHDSHQRGGGGAPQRTSQPSDTSSPLDRPPPPPSKNNHPLPAHPNQASTSEDAFSPTSSSAAGAAAAVSRRGTFERSGTPGSTTAPFPPQSPTDGEDLRSPISPQSPDQPQAQGQFQGLWGRLRRG